MAAFTTRKIIIYRSNLRLTSGQHDVWCDKGVNDVRKKWVSSEMCMKHLRSYRERYDNSVAPEVIYRYLPAIDRRPVLCKTIVPIDHFKFIGGAESYLRERAQDYKSRGMYFAFILC